VRQVVTTHRPEPLRSLAMTMGTMSENTNEKIDALAEQAKTATNKVTDAAHVAAKATGEKVRDAGKATAEKLEQTAKKIEGASADLGKKMGA
jgi:superfamily II RNA helicase